MIYLQAFWIIFITFMGFYSIISILKIKNIKYLLDEKIGILIFLIVLPLVIMAIITKDPINFLETDVPVQIQWFVSLIGTGFLSWKYYLNPLKIKVYEMDIQINTKISGIEKDVKSLKDDINLIKEKIINGKIKIR